MRVEQCADCAGGGAAFSYMSFELEAGTVETKFPYGSEETLDRMRISRPLRQIAETVRSNPDAAIPDPSPVLRALRLKSAFGKDSQAVALWLISAADWTPDQRGSMSEALCAHLTRQLKRQAVPRVVSRWFQRSVTIWLLGLVGIAACVGQIVDILVLWAVFTLAVAVGSVPYSGWMDDRGLRHCVAAIEALGVLGLPAGLPVIASAYVHRALRTPSTVALRRILPQLREGDYGTLPGMTVPALCRALPKADTEITLAFFAALRVIGDGRAIEAVKTVMGTTRSVEVRDAALRLLPVLHERAAKIHTASVLLRASGSPDGDEHTLLRAARGEPTAEPSALLRATVMNDDDASTA